MILPKSDKIKTNDGAIYQVTLSDTTLPKMLWYKVYGTYYNFVSEAIDAVLAALIIPVMHYGEDLKLKGKVSENILFHINNDFQAIYRIFHPHLKKITVHADSFYNKSIESENLATGFSGGIDSFYTLGDYYYTENVPVGFRITHLL